MISYTMPLVYVAVVFCIIAADTACRHKAKDISPAITWRREA